MRSADLGVAPSSPGPGARSNATGSRGRSCYERAWNQLFGWNRFKDSRVAKAHRFNHHRRHVDDWLADRRQAVTGLRSERHIIIAHDRLIVLDVDGQLPRRVHAVERHD